MSEKRKTIPFGAVFVLCILGLCAAAANIPSLISMLRAVGPDYLIFMERCLGTAAGIGAFLLVILKKPKGAAILPAVSALLGLESIIFDLVLMNSELPDGMTSFIPSQIVRSVIQLLAAVMLLLAVLKVKPKITLIAAIALYAVSIVWSLVNVLLASDASYYLIPLLKDIALTPVYWLTAVQAVMLRKEKN